MNRRQFVASMPAAGWTARSWDSVPGANDRLHVALAGCGIEGRGIAGFASRSPFNAVVTAVCDVFSEHLEIGKRELGTPHGVADFRRLLEDKHIDAIMVATPDHWHATISVLACEAGKDVYCEKPLANNIADGRKIVSAARRHGRIVQMGNQGRTALHIKEAVGLVRSGQLGDVRFVRVWDTVNATAWRAGIEKEPEPSPMPTGLNWDFFLGPAPARPYDERRHHGWRNYYDTGGGSMTDMGVHLIDTVLRAMDCDAPRSVYAVGRRYGNPDIDVPDVLQATYDFPNFTMAYESRLTNGFGMGNRGPGLKYHYPKGEYDRPHGIAFFGTNGTLIADPDCYEVFPEPGGTDPNGNAVYRMERKRVNSPDGTNGKEKHVRNWLECVRSRKAPNSEVEIGHRSSIVAHLGNIAWRVGKQLTWSRDAEDFTGCPEATALLGTEARKEYAWI